MNTDKHARRITYCLIIGAGSSRFRRLAVVAINAVLAAIGITGNGSGAIALRAAEPHVTYLLAEENPANLYAFIRGEGVKPIPNDVFSIENGILRVSGTKKAYLATRNQYRNFRLIAEYRWAAASPKNDSGVFLHAVGPDKWLMQSIEVQLATKPDTHSGDLILIGGKKTHLTVNGVRHQGPFKVQPEDRKDRELPVGQWNRLEIIARDGNIEVRVNGQLTARGSDSVPHSGKIFVQSNHGEIFFRRLDIESPAR